MKREKTELISSGITDALLTTLIIILLTAYTGIHFYIRYLFDVHYSKEDFTIITVNNNNFD